MSSVPLAIIGEIEAHTGCRFKGFSPCSGGCINHGGKVSTSNGTFFLKWNDRQRFPGMFTAEVRGLGLLRQAGPIKIPEVIYAGVTGEFQFLLLEYIGEDVKAKNYWQDFGSRLASLHKNTSAHFGLDHDNYIGSLVQVNTPSPSWVPFFIERRLAVQTHAARDMNRLDLAQTKRLEKLFGKLDALLPAEQPALLHGDLWSGNVMTTSQGPCLIDPAVYYGNREMDLAMTQLFGGFDSSYYNSYEEVYPLCPGYEERTDLYNLYPLLVHLNLFGGGYNAQIETITKRFL